MILLRALLNGILGMAAFFLLFAGCDRVLVAIAPAIAEPPVCAWVAGSLAAIATLIAMSVLQRRARQLSIGNLIVQNTLSVAFIVVCLIPIQS